jgi:hypothetical protein
MSLYILACRVLESILTPYLRARNVPVTFLEYGHHRAPQLLAPALQAELERIEEPSVFIIGYGLCGNGLHGVRAGRHTLIVPRADDCITLFLGSYQSYIHEFNAEPGTYYLTKGWLESGSHPLKEYGELLEKYDRETADWIIDEQYKNYTRLVLLAPSQAELDECRPRARAVADFCQQRWGYRYEERLGSDNYVKRLATAAIELKESTDDFLVIPPGGEIRQDMYWRKE